MKAVRALVAAVLAFVVLAVPAVVLAADGRVALVVGNSTYAHIGRLPNGENDARGMSAALRRLGFEVTTELDADRVALSEALRRFTRRGLGQMSRWCSTRATGSRWIAELSSEVVGRRNIGNASEPVRRRRRARAVVEGGSGDRPREGKATS